MATESRTTPSKSSTMARGKRRASEPNGFGLVRRGSRELLDQIEEPLAEVEVRGPGQTPRETRLIRVGRHLVMQLLGAALFGRAVFDRDSVPEYLPHHREQILDA